MSTSITTLTPACQNWCKSHQADAAGRTVHLSSLDVASNGVVTALRMTTDASHGLVGSPSLVILTPPSDEAKGEWAQTFAAA